MRILHIAPNAPYNDYWGYQDNLLPKYHAKLGHEVSLIVTNTMHSNGTIREIAESRYDLSDGVHVIRRKYRKYLSARITRFLAHLDVYDLIVEFSPDFIFFHGLVSVSIFDAIRYKRKCNPSCVIVQDNHLDYYNTRQKNSVRAQLMRTFRRCAEHFALPHIARVYGVTPWRKQFAEDYFCVPKSKTDVLIMGADDEQIDLANKDVIRESLRKKHGISPDDFLIVTGGKIDETKNIHLLMEAVRDLSHVSLVVFGEPTGTMQEYFQNFHSPNVQCIGWIPAEETYAYFMSADLVAFPGTHSVMWEQACACKVPCLFAHWDGMDHVNNGGNSDFIFDVTAESLRETILRLLFTDKYYNMKTVATSDATDIYLYSKIAEKSLECANKNESKITI